jgi:hypothetical protein
MSHFERYGSKLSTNDKLTKFLEDAIRGDFHDDDDDKSKPKATTRKEKKKDKTKRLSDLYGLNVQHNLVKDRSHASLPPMPLSPTLSSKQLQQELTLRADSPPREHFASRQSSLNTNMRGMPGSYSNPHGQSIPTTESTLHSTKTKFVADDADRRPWYLGQNNTASTTPGSAFAKV